eukprot:TRINITY_DN14861_c0_g1_i2.p1 TRINITY_DN14861_c0_g1~~TRINITY_DN14861_c0_g1_i2.p1  ORF type:complete len:456 (-),score=77.61 TRINITY_DN14861_c0_g1_i2:67-1434(-)
MAMVQEPMESGCASVAMGPTRSLRQSSRPRLVCARSQIDDVVPVLVGSAEAGQEVFSVNQFAMMHCSDALGSLLEQDAGPIGQVVLPDVSPRAFQQLMHLANGSPLEITVDNFFEILHLASRYAVDELRSQAMLWAADLITTAPEGALELLNKAVPILESESTEASTEAAFLDDALNAMFLGLAQHAEQWMTPSADSVIQAFSELDIAVVKRLLRDEDVLVCNEERLWCCLLRWADRGVETGRTEAPVHPLRLVAHKVRFNLMRPDFFVDCVMPWNVLDQEQVTEYQLGSGARDCIGRSASSKLCGFLRSARNTGEPPTTVYVGPVLGGADAGQVQLRLNQLSMEHAGNVIAGIGLVDSSTQDIAEDFSTCSYVSTQPETAAHFGAAFPDGSSVAWGERGVIVIAWHLGEGTVTYSLDGRDVTLQLPQDCGLDLRVFVHFLPSHPYWSAEVSIIG